MTRQISQRELRNQSGEILRAVDRGEEFVITRNGVPVAELKPIPQKKTFISGAELARIFRNAPPIDAKRFRVSEKGICLITQDMIDRLGD